MMLPTEKPPLSRYDVEKIMTSHDVNDLACVVGIRGYYSEKNERGIYDDAMFIYGPECLVAFNANTDPSRAKDKVATLEPGVYEYVKGNHGISGPSPYPALRQYSNVRVRRDGEDQIFEDNVSNRFWINIHRGGYTTTSSEGCQTIYPDQWESFISLAYRIMSENKMTKIKYILVDEVNHADA